MLNRDQILNAQDRKIQTVPVPEWGGDVSIRVMTGSEKEAWSNGIIASGKATADRFQVKLCAATICDDTGGLLLSETDLDALAQKSCVPIQRIFDAAYTLNGLGKEDREELVKN